MLLITPVRPGDSNEELRYALRSWETNLHLPTPLELMVVGDCPTWLKPDHFVQGNSTSSAPLNVFDNVWRGSLYAEDEGYTDALYMNDDFFCLDPVGSVLPVRRNCTLEEHIAQFPVNAGMAWARSLRLTASWLAEQGYTHPNSYEVHRPLPAAPSDMILALGQLKRAQMDTVPQWRTVYGTLNEVDAYPVQDVKLGLASDGYGTPWVSTSDHSWRRYATDIRQRFQKPSRWEV